MKSTKWPINSKKRLTGLSSSALATLSGTTSSLGLHLARQKITCTLLRNQQISQDLWQRFLMKSARQRFQIHAIVTKQVASKNAERNIREPRVFAREAF